MELVFLGRIALATLLAGLLGWDRERKSRPAGLRTHMLVGLSSALFVSLGEVYVTRQVSDHVMVDPIRVLEAIATGVSFLGAGTVFVSRGHVVQGLTTAASLWAVSAVGVAVGLGEYTIATGTTLLALAVLASATRMERHIARQKPPEMEVSAESDRA